MERDQIIYILFERIPECDPLVMAAYRTNTEAMAHRSRSLAIYSLPEDSQSVFIHSCILKTFPIKKT
jgi:hypothetical protein